MDLLSKNMGAARTGAATPARAIAITVEVRMMNRELSEVRSVRDVGWIDQNIRLRGITARDKKTLGNQYLQKRERR